MRFIALLRGINVGTQRRVEMKKLKLLFESLEYLNVSTYINSGNVIFESDQDSGSVENAITKGIKKEFGFEVPTLIKTKQELQEIVASIPVDWKNDLEQKSDVAYLFPEIDDAKTIDMLPIKKNT
jgi:uncharacterized protein (DUF1697 family)